MRFRPSSQTPYTWLEEITMTTADQNPYIDTGEHPLLYLAKSGSHLFGTDTPSSDLDIKGLFLPTKSSLYLQNSPRQFSNNSNLSDQKNTKEDTDVTVWSLQFWLELLQKGDQNAISLLFSWTHPGAVLQADPRFLERLKSLEPGRLLSRKLNGMIGFVASQAVRYTDKGKHYRALKLMVDVLENAPLEAKIQDTLQELFQRAPLELFEGWENMLYVREKEEHSHRAEGVFWILVVVGKMYDYNAGAKWALESLKPELNKYGKRALLASQSGVDFKAFSHSLRVLEEIRVLHRTGTLEYPHPLEFAKYLTSVKLGEFGYEALVASLEERLALTEAAAQNSVLPLEFDVQYAQDFLLEWYK